MAIRRDNKGRIIKGSGGREKGVANKKTQMWNELGEFIVNEGADKYLEHLKVLEPDKYMERFERVLEYFKPKLSRTTVDDPQRDKINNVLEGMSNDDFTGEPETS